MPIRYTISMSSAFKLSLVIMGVVIGVGIASASYLNGYLSLEGKVEVRIRNQIILADTAADEKSRERGLSGRDTLEINEGMLFRFDEAGVYSFWMKDMQFPIDIVWIRENRIVGFKESVPTEPYAAEGQLKRYFPPEPVDKVLELTAGRVRLLRASIGDVVQVRPLVKTPEP